ncbi:glycosyltransferase family 2 protein [Ichthyenterobacterium sp. W332]|uniref:Glycosyltransferase family 2 protein n=1 Tax=Microcosmobacter mediterraneus TaxID=3075607 RepID=A0ABU2YN01_9FLAO|nr:glycosyltransferase family 2 protein [Ichthyenterobacterium sp. W332]MDT0559516.1 glycosyltransferase family 2 protein [Ichthyenterobacterium sp. W332]
MISALAITYNEEDYIERYVQQLSFADEIIFIDSFSTDNTVDLAQKYGVKVIQRKFDNFSTQRNFALEHASNDWVIFFDLDESLPNQLISEIKTIVKENSKNYAYRVKRNFYFMGKHIKYSGFQNDTVVRLFNKTKCTYNGNLVHETLSVNGTIGSLKNTLDHYTYKTFDDYNKKQTQYSKLQAKHLYNKNVRPNLYHFFVRPLYRFLHQYFIKLGFLDGKEGFILAYLQGFSVFKRYLFLWTTYRNIE